MKLIEFIAQSDVLQLAIAGAAGGLVRALTMGEKFRAALVAVLSGGLSATYLGPPASEIFSRWFGLEVNPGNIGFGGFIVGMLAVGMSGFFTDLVSGYVAKSRGRKND